MRYGLPLLALAFAHPCHAQQDRIPGPPPDEYVDVTGDGRADLLITSRTIHISDPQQPGYLGQYKVGVRTLAGTAVLMWSTPSNQRWFTLDSAARLDTAELAARIHFKQLSWTDEDKATEFWLLERPFGPAITKDQDGWYGTGDHHDGQTMVLRSANERGTSIAAFTFELPYPYGRVVVNKREALRVPNGFGDEGDPVQPKPKVLREFDFGHEEVEPQVMVPPGLPPDEPVDTNDDDVPDLVVTGYVGARNACVTRGVSPANGAAFLMQRNNTGGWDHFLLVSGEALTPDYLKTGLEEDHLKWASSDHGAFYPVLHHGCGDEQPASGWAYSNVEAQGDPVFRTMQYDRPIIGVLSVTSAVPGGELGVGANNWVDEGQVLFAP